MSDQQRALLLCGRPTATVSVVWLERVVTTGQLNPHRRVWTTLQVNTKLLIRSSCRRYIRSVGNLEPLCCVPSRDSDTRVFSLRKTGKNLVVTGHGDKWWQLLMKIKIYTRFWRNIVTRYLENRRSEFRNNEHASKWTEHCLLFGIWLTTKVFVYPAFYMRNAWFICLTMKLRQQYAV